MKYFTHFNVIRRRLIMNTKTFHVRQLSASWSFLLWQVVEEYMQTVLKVFLYFYEPRSHALAYKTF